jgi:NAD(P)-dependent dehydrogenase (short-subunit alcohol dehydrogenase family)
VKERLTGKVCIVTGAGRGIGLAYVDRFRAEGASVIGLDVEFDDADAAEFSLVCDVTDRAAAHAAVGEVVQRWGRLDVVVNNAALYAGIALRYFADIPEAEWEHCFAVNVRGVWNMCSAAATAMREQSGGSIINISSNVVAMGKVGFLHYVASKGAVQAMTGAMSRELAGTGIRVNALAPGYTTTAATRNMADPATVQSLEHQILAAQSIKQLLEPADLTGAAVFLASDDSGLMTGQTLTIDGGVVI